MTFTTPWPPKLPAADINEAAVLARSPAPAFTEAGR